jgi:hypothetical protein
MVPYQRIEERASFLEHFLHDALVLLVGRDDLVLTEILAPQVNTDEEVIRRYFHALDLPVPELLHQ